MLYFLLRLLELKCHACFLTICMYIYININMLIILHAMIMCVLWHMTSSGYNSIKHCKTFASSHTQNRHTPVSCILYYRSFMFMR